MDSDGADIESVYEKDWSGLVPEFPFVQTEFEDDGAWQVKKKGKGKKKKLEGTDKLKGEGVNERTMAWVEAVFKNVKEEEGISSDEDGPLSLKQIKDALSVELWVQQKAKKEKDMGVFNASFHRVQDLLKMMKDGEVKDLG